MNMKRIAISILLAFACIVSASAQHNFRTGYFLDGYIYKHKLNPAFASDRGYFAIPVAGQVSVGAETNLSLSTLLYPDGNGNLVTFLSPSVSAEDFMKGIQTNNPLRVNAELPVLSLGFHAGKSFNTIDLSLKTDVRTNLPGSFFSWAKQSGDMMDLSDFGLKGDARLELSYGYSRPIGEKFRFGFKLKFLAGLAKASYNMDKLTLTMEKNAWSAAAKGNGYFSAPGIGLVTDDAGAITGFDVPAYDMALISELLLESRNFGGAVDLGISYDILPWLTLSASVTDLGFINWDGLSRLESADNTVDYAGFENIGDEGTDIGADFEALGNELLQMIYPKVTSDSAILMDMLSMTSHVGLELSLPFYKRLSVGALGTYRFDGPYSWWEARGSLNWAIFRWLSFSASYAQSTYGESYGGAMNFHPNGLNIFVGVDSFKPALNLTKQYIPIDSFNTNLVAGVNIAFGKYHGRFQKKSKR